MSAVRFRFFRDFDWRGPSRRCVFCKLAIWAFKKTPTETSIEIPEAAALEAEQAGAGERVDT